MLVMFSRMASCINLRIRPKCPGVGGFILATVKKIEFASVYNEAIYFIIYLNKYFFMCVYYIIVKVNINNYLTLSEYAVNQSIQEGDPNSYKNCVKKIQKPRALKKRRIEHHKMLIRM